MKYPDVPGHVRGIDTSFDAALAIAENASALEARIMAWLKAGNAGTAREIARALGLEWAQVTPRTATLHAQGLIEWTGERRRDPVTGRNGNVCRAAIPPAQPPPTETPKYQADLFGEEGK